MGSGECILDEPPFHPTVITYHLRDYPLANHHHRLPLDRQVLHV